MIGINLSDYRLVYYRIEDSKKFLVRRVSNGEYVVLDPENNLKSKITYRILKRDFIPDDFQNNKILKTIVGVRLS
jgi:hypothetical protein